jgi:hypothetical protein
MNEKNTITKENELKKIEDHKKEKKENVNIKSVEGGLNKLLQKLTTADENNDIITPDSSENEQQDNSTVILNISDISNNIQNI